MTNMSIDRHERKWVVAQIGARQHYAVARAIYQQERLHQLYTDAWCSLGRELLQALPDPFRSFANRYHPDLPQSHVTSFTTDAIRQRMRWKLRRRKTDEARFQHHVEIGHRFGERVVKDLKEQRVNPDEIIFFGYDTGCYEVAQWMKETEGTVVVDQIDPGRVEKEIVLEEIKRWPGWATQVPVLYPPHYERIEAEWDLASIVMVNSQWSKDALIQQGVSESKIEIIPIAYEPKKATNKIRNTKSDGLFRVLWLGSVILRKGIQYLIEAAKLLSENHIQIDVVGPIGITEEALQKAPECVTFHGRVPRDETSQWYQNADFFVLPTLSDGFAITQLEAMAHGLPVITTPRCGTVVEDGTSGFIIPARDPESLAKAIGKASSLPYLDEMKEQAHRRVYDFRLSHIGNKLVSMVNNRIRQ